MTADIWDAVPDDPSFDSIKSNILIDLQLGTQHVNVDLVEMVAALNRHHDYATTSSCGGRISFFHKDITSPGAAEIKMKRGAGLGIVFSSHDPVEESEATVLRGYPLDVPSLGILKLKMEPLILHVMCRNVKTGQGLVLAAIAAGLKRSGMILSSKGHVNVVARGGYGFCAPLVMSGKEVVPRANVIALLGHANRMMAVNVERRERFMEQIHKLL